MAHIAPSWVKDWAYAAGKATIVKMFDYLQAQQPDWHVVQLHPGVISTEINARFGVVGQDTRKYYPMVILPSVKTLLMKMSCSWTLWPFRCLACLTRGCIPEEQIRRGKLGRAGAQSSS